MATNNKYAAIAAVLSWTEYEASADGLFLQPEEAETINTALENAATENLAGITTERDAHAATIVTLTQNVNTLTAERDALQAKVDALNAKPSGPGTKISTVEDPKTEIKVAAHEADSPHNLAADEHVRRYNARKKIKES